MQKLDLTKLYKSYYTAKTKPEIVEIEAANFLSIRGKGDPSGELFAEKIQALYPVAYTIKFHFKPLGKDFTVAKLEGLWWFDEEKFTKFSMQEAPQKIPRSEWEYRLLIRLPEFVGEKDVKQAIEKVRAKKTVKYLDEVEFFEMEEGKCVQMLHVGSFDKEPESLEKIMQFCEENKLDKNGLHHEIYLSDFRKAAPEKLKTILREPVKA